MTRKLSKRKKFPTLALLIMIFSFIEIGGFLSASANLPVAPTPSACGMSLSDGGVAQEYQIAALEDAKAPFIRLISPHGGEVWAEGKTYEIRWESEEIDEVYISVAVGGKDKGLLEEEGKSKIDAKRGKITWIVPVGFITGFGIAQSDRVRIMIFDIKNSAILGVSEYFTIEGARNIDTDSSAQNKVLSQDEYREAIIQYYEAIANKHYREAYDMLGQCKIVLYDADGSGVSFQPREDYDAWLKAQKTIDNITIIEAKRYQGGGAPLKYSADQGDAEATLGIRTYMVTLSIKLHEENWTIKSGRTSLFVTVVKGTDDKVRIIGIGSGP